MLSQSFPELHSTNSENYNIVQMGIPTAYQGV